MAGNRIAPERRPEMLDQGEETGLPRISNRDMACAILPNFDYEAQLLAISSVLQRNEEADKRVREQIKELDEYARRTTGARNERAVEEFGDCFHISIWQGAAHSMAAVGMLAPLYESMLFQAFQGIRARFFGADVIPPGHPRSEMTVPDQFWDCHCVYNERKKKIENRQLLRGIPQLAQAVGLNSNLPNDLHRVLEALFGYRNKMFHSGFEWPENECRRFSMRIEREGWHTWFARAERAHEPWIFYMTQDFISHCLETVHQLLESFGTYCKGRNPIRTIPIA